MMEVDNDDSPSQEDLLAKMANQPFTGRDRALKDIQKLIDDGEVVVDCELYDLKDVEFMDEVEWPELEKLRFQRNYI